MKVLIIAALSLSLISCSSSVKKGADVQKMADGLNTHVSSQRSKLGTGYKKHVSMYRQMQASGFRKNKAPMPELLEELKKMRKLALSVRAKMSAITFKTTRMSDIAEGREEITDKEPEFREIDELKEKIQAELAQLESLAKTYGQYSDRFKARVKESGVYTIRTEDLRSQTEQYAESIGALLDKAKASAKSSEERSTLVEMEKLGEQALNLSDKLLLRFKDDEVIVGPKNDPRDVIVRIHRLLEKIKELDEEI